jgi:hypothetical protein
MDSLLHSFSTSIKRTKASVNINNALIDITKWVYSGREHLLQSLQTKPRALYKRPPLFGYQIIFYAQRISPEKVGAQSRGRWTNRVREMIQLVGGSQRIKRGGSRRKTRHA